MDALSKAIDFFGTQAALAEALGLKSAMAVSQWKKRRVPLERARQIEEKTNGTVSAYDLRPDFFDAPPEAPRTDDPSDQEAA